MLIFDRENDKNPVYLHFNGPFNLCIRLINTTNIIHGFILARTRRVGPGQALITNCCFLTLKLVSESDLFKYVTKKSDDLYITRKLLFSFKT